MLMTMSILRFRPGVNGYTFEMVRDLKPLDCARNRVKKLLLLVRLCSGFEADACV